jgi:hypothetical protein
MRRKKTLEEKAEVGDNYYGPLARHAKLRATRDKIVERGMPIKYSGHKKK